MEKEQQENTNQKAKTPLADEKHQLTAEEHHPKDKVENKEYGKLPEDDFGTDHNSDPILAKNQ